MNKTSIEWCDYTWNPVTGCFHPCRLTYCYNTIKSTSPLNRFGAVYIDENGKKACEKDWQSRQTHECHISKKGEIYPYGYDPTFYPHRLNEPFKTKKPARIFSVDTGDLFGKWVPADWITQTIEVVEKCPRHTFQFLTKNPGRLLDIAFPDNSWVGVSINTNRDKPAADLLKKVRAKVRFLSIEPLLGEVDFCFKGLQWIIIGAKTGKNPFQPQKEWVDEIVRQAESLAIPIFIKNNLNYYPQRKEFPSGTVHL